MVDEKTNEKEKVYTKEEILNLYGQGLEVYALKLMELYAKNNKIPYREYLNYCT